MNIRLSAVDGRALVVGGLALGGLLAFARGWPAVRAWEADRLLAAQTADRRATALMQGFAERDRLTAKLRGLQASSSTGDSVIFAGRDAAAISARMISELRRLAAGDDVVVQSLQPRIESSRSRKTILASARVAATTDVEGLTDFVRDLEAAAPPFRIVDLSIVVAEPAAAKDRPDVLKLEMTIQAIATVRVARGSAHEN